MYRTFHFKTLMFFLDSHLISPVFNFIECNFEVSNSTDKKLYKCLGSSILHLYPSSGTKAEKYFLDLKIQISFQSLPMNLHSEQQCQPITTFVSYFRFQILIFED